MKMTKSLLVLEAQNRKSEAQLLDEIEWLCRHPRIFVPVSGGYQLVEFTAETLERKLAESPYLEGGSLRHIAGCPAGKAA